MTLPEALIEAGKGKNVSNVDLGITISLLYGHIFFRDCSNLKSHWRPYVPTIDDILSSEWRII